MNERYQQSRNDGRTVPYDEWQRRMGATDPSRDNEWQRGPFYGDQQGRQDSWGREPMRGDFVRSQQDGATEWMPSPGRSFDPQSEWIPQQGRTYPRQPGSTQSMRSFEPPIEMQPQAWFSGQGTWSPPGGYTQRGSSTPERWSTDGERWTTLPQRRALLEQYGPMQQGSMQYGPMQFGPMQQGPMQYGPMQQAPMPYGLMPYFGEQPLRGGMMLRRQLPWRDQDVAPQTNRGRGPRNYQRSDERIREDICDVLLHDHLIDATQIEVEVTRGDVALTGKVADRWEKFRAEDISANIPGVRDVTNQLKVEEIDPRTGRTESDDTTTGSGRSTSKGSRTNAG